MRTRSLATALWVRSCMTSLVEVSYPGLEVLCGQHNDCTSFLPDIMRKSFFNLSIVSCRERPSFAFKSSLHVRDCGVFLCSSKPSPFQDV